MMTPEEAIRRFPKPQEAAFVGFSGGADSTALLIALHRAHWPVTAVHFQHHLRGEAAEEDARWCEAFCRRHDIPFRRIDIEVTAAMQRGEALEAAARRLRLETWHRLTREAHLPVFLAHHADDRIEEFFLRLARGANATGLTPLRPIRKFEDGTVFYRPLLECRKAGLEAYLTALEISDWRHDATNDENDCRRNAVRNRLLPLFREICGTDAGILAALDALYDDADFIEKSATREPHSLRDWQQLPPALLTRMLRRHLKLPLPPSKMTVRRIAAALDNFQGTTLLPLGAGKRVAITQNGIELLPEELPFEPVVWNWRSTPAITLANGAQFAIGGALPLTERFAAGALPETLVIRPWHPGDDIQPFGLNGHHRKVSALFAQHHIPAPRRAAWPLLCAGETPIWIPAIARAEFGRVTTPDSQICISACLP